MGDKLNERNSARRKFMRSAGTLGLAGFFGGQAVSGFADNRKKKPENHNEIEYESSADGVAGTASGGTRAGLATSNNGVVGTTTLPFENGQRELVQYPGKRPMIRLTTEALQLETPFQVFISIKFKAMHQVKNTIHTDEILKGLDEGLKPILQNIKAEQLSSTDKKAILSKLEQLEQLALQIKKELLKS